MKKKWLILVSIIFIWNNSITAQTNGIVTYQYIRLPDTLTGNPEKNKAIRLVQKAAEYAQNHQYVLLFNANESYYHTEIGIKPDDVNSMAYDLSKFMMGTGDFYQNKTQKKLINYKHLLGKDYAVTDSLQIQAWHITNEFKYIDKYKVYKAWLFCASCNINVTAWFTPQIPLPFGPAGYGGLPGLILEVKKYKNILRIKKIKFTKKDIKIDLPKNSIPISKQKLEELTWQKRMDMMSKTKK